ncbi:hypothetical protein [Natronosalvus caseinilyticus]|uniref:hypothetical protein n=1 Tax=Natronosalvus caseinilyticus TaxID=2953747 RepID=UPI0028AA610B|nr:hypothetical protein [Natronosalvus caseinilyticus]
MIEVPLQTIDNLLRPFHMGHALIGLLVLAILGTLPLKSMKIMGINLAALGALFLLVPTSLTDNMVVFRLIGIVLVLVGPILYAGGR